MKKITFIVSSLAITLSSIAQNADTTKPATKNWTKGGVGGINFSQSSFTNWAAGGENALSATALVSLYANCKKDKSN